MMSKLMSLMNESSDSEEEIKINKDYASKYNDWRNKEEMQKLKDLTKDISDSSSESEDEEEPIIEEDFLTTLSLLKSEDSKIYDKSKRFFKDNTNTEKAMKSKKEKPMFLKDYERKIVLERNGQFSDDDEEHIPTKGPTIVEEQEESKRNFQAAMGDSDSDDDLLQVHKKTIEEKKEEEEDYIKWMKGKKKEISKETEDNLSYLHTFWNDPKLDDNEKFLRDYILNKRYMDEDKPSKIPIPEMMAELNDDDTMSKQQEEFEHKYNFRFEEPDQEFIKKYPRTIDDSMRPADTKRKMKREVYSERKKKEKDLKREELKRLKALRRKEIEEKFSKLKEVSGADELHLNESDIEEDFDEEKHDKKMKELFNDDYYAVEEEEKPTFEYDDELDEINWDHWTRDNENADDVENSTSNEDPQSSKCTHKSDDVLNEDISGRNKFEQEMIGSATQRKRKPKKKSLFAKVISNPKPIFDADGKSFDEYLDEYYKMDFEDLIGDMPVRYKYRKVVPNDFGLSVEEIMSATDKELNQWCSVKKTYQYREKEEELYDLQAFKKKASRPQAKQRVFPSLFSNKQEKDAENAASESKKKNKRILYDDAANEPVNSEPTPKYNKNSRYFGGGFQEQKELGKKDHGTFKPNFNKNKKNNGSEGHLNITDKRLSAYGIQPKKFKNKHQYY